MGAKHSKRLRGGVVFGVLFMWGGRKMEGKGWEGNRSQEVVSQGGGTGSQGLWLGGQESFGSWKPWSDLGF